MRLIPRSLQARTACVIALAFFVFLSLFFATTYFSIHNSRLARSDSEVRAALETIVSTLQPGLPDEAISHTLSEHSSIGESPLLFIVLERSAETFIERAGSFRAFLPNDIEEKMKQHPGQTIDFSTPGGDMRLLSIARGNFIAGAVYNTIVLEETEESITQVFSYYLAAGLLIGILGGIFLSRYLIGPISSLATAARDILHQPEQSTARLPVPEAITEVADLAQSINELLDARERALELQRNFAADAAHELRTPLTVLKGEIEVELRIAEHDSPHAELLRSNLEEIERLISTVQDLLELAEIEAENDRIAADNECSLLSAIHYAAGHLRSIAEARGIEFVVPEKDIKIAAQEERITRLIYNLLLNAVQHSGVSRKVEIRLHITDEGCVVEIEDHGKGIPSDRIEHLFERFYSTGYGSSKKQGSAGLGLAIVKSIAGHYGFRLSVRSAEGAGTTVTLHIPRAAIIG